MHKNGKGKSMPAAKAQKKTSITVVQGGSKSVSLPAVISKVMQADFNVSKGSKRGSIRIKGQDWLGRLSIPANSVAGQAIGEFYINPSDYPGTRLALFAQLFDKFKFLVLRFKFVPNSGTASPGSIIIAYDRDISDPTPPASDVGIRAYLSMLDAVSGPVWQPLDCVCPLADDQTALYTNEAPGGDPRLAYQGQVYVALLEPPSAAASVAGDLFVDYDVELYDPQLEPVVAIGNCALTGPTPLNGGPLNNDTLYTFVNGIVNGSNKASTPVYVPKVDSTGKAYLDLAQGVYRIYQSMVQTQAGGINLGTPTVADIVPNDPKPSPAPQPQLSGPNITITNGFPELAIKAALMSIPPGGARYYSTATDFSGYDPASAATSRRLQVDKLASAWSDLSTFV